MPLNYDEVKIVIRKCFYLPLVSLLFFSTTINAETLSDMLQRMSDADNNKNYQGIFILRKSDSISTLRVTHGVTTNGIWETLEALNGEQRKVIRHNHRVISVYPERELVTIRHADSEKALHAKLPDNINQLDSYYDIQRLDDDRIANHDALVLDLTPKDQFRYGYRYWVDANTGMLLRCDLISDDKSIVEQMMFTSLEYLEESPAHSDDISQFHRYKQQILNEAKNDITNKTPRQWVINQLPKGFMLMQSTMRQSSPLNSQNESETPKPDLLHMVYSDGLASVSVFIEKNLGNEKHMQGESSMGAVNAFGSPAGDFFVTVVGEVPVNTVKLMAQSAVNVDQQNR